MPSKNRARRKNSGKRCSTGGLLGLLGIAGPAVAWQVSPWALDNGLTSCQRSQVLGEHILRNVNQTPSPKFREAGELMWSPGRSPRRKRRSNGSDLQKQPAGAPDTHLNMRSPTMTSRQTDDSTTATTARMVVWS